MAYVQYNETGKATSPDDRGNILRLPTGISGLDVMLSGGLPLGRSFLVCGSTGAGKTVLLNEFIYRGVTKYDQNGVFVTMEERPEDITANVKGFGWDYRPLLAEGRLAFVDLSPDPYDAGVEISSKYQLTPLITRIRHAVERVHAHRVAIDGLAAIFARFTNKEAVRSVLFQIMDQLKRMGVTSMISAEKIGGSEPLSREGMVEFVADGALDMNLEVGEQQFVRSMFIRKLRGAGFRSGKVVYEMGPRGLEVFPKIPTNPALAETHFDTKKQTGVPALDEALGGGVPQGHIMLVSGNTGTGKTLFTLQFLQEGLKDGEHGVFVALEEPVAQVKKTARSFAWDLEGPERENRLRFIGQDLIDINPDRLLYQIIHAVDAIGAKRLTLDSVSSLISQSLDVEKVRQFLIQLAGILKSRGVTSLLTYLAPSNFGAIQGSLLGEMQSNDMRLSSVTDAIVLMRYLERDQKVEKLLTVLKNRGSQHSKEIRRYDIDQRGIVLADRSI